MVGVQLITMNTATTFSSNNRKSRSEKRGFIESIHLLRGFAAILVLLDHTFGWNDLGWGSLLVQPVDGHGEVGVVMFFIISGFVLPYSMKPSYRVKHYFIFIAKRLVRLDPVYLVALLFSAALLYAKTWIATGGEAWVPSIGQALAHFMYLLPFTPYTWFNEVFWTLGVEFQFYVLSGLLLPFVKKSLENHSRYFCAACLILAALVIPFGPAVAKFGFVIVPYATLFLIGIVGYGYYVNHLSKNECFVTSSLLILFYSISEKGDLWEGGIAAATIFLILFWTAPKLRVRAFGTISYSLYVIHYPITTFINGNVGRTLTERGGLWPSVPWIFPLASIVFSLAAAYLLYTLVEVPTIRWSKKITYTN